MTNEEYEKAGIELMKKMTEQERRAVLLVVDGLNFEQEAAPRLVGDDTISVCKCRNGREAVWAISEVPEMCVYVDSLEELTAEEIAKQLL